MSERERAIFEAGIALSAIYHQLVGMPINRSRRVVSSLERAAREAFRLQPFKRDVRVRIDSSKVKTKRPFRYESLKGHHLDVRVKCRYGKSEVIGRMRHIADLDYTLMYVEAVR